MFSEVTILIASTANLIASTANLITAHSRPHLISPCPQMSLYAC